MDFTVTTNCPEWSGQYDVPAVLFSNVISQGGQNYTYSYRNGESKTSYLYASADGSLSRLDVTGAPEYALIQNGAATDVKVVNHLAAGDVQLKSTELFTVTTQGNLRHTVTFSNEGATPLTGTLRQTLDTDLNGDDNTTLYANGQGNVYITSHDFTLTAEKLEGTATLYAGSWVDPSQVSSVDGIANGTKVAEGLDTAIYYETGALNLQPGQSTTMAYQETVYKAGEYVPGIATRTLSFDTQGGSAVAPQRVPLGSVTTKPADPTRAGYTFAGWTTDKEGKNAFKFGEALPEDLTIYAQWKKAPAATTPKLANTGASVAGIAGLALAGLVAGGAALAARRRRD